MQFIIEKERWVYCGVGLGPYYPNQAPTQTGFKTGNLSGGFKAYIRSFPTRYG